MKHWHHIIPKHAGGTDDSSNLVQLSIEEHAEEHRKLWKKYHRWQDRIAWQTLSGQINSQEVKEIMMKQYNPMYNENVKKKMSGENHWSKREKNKNKILFGNINAMKIPEVVKKRSGENHWSKLPGKIHNAKTNHPKGSSKKIMINDIVYSSIKEACEKLNMSDRKIKKIGIIIKKGSK
jgi:TPP-dependent indolepyruvate ferredoxin oxidoreductase alpha subunit